MELSFHKISKKNPSLKKKWIKVLKRKGVREPGPSHRICSANFVDGKKSYINKILTVFYTSMNAPRRSPALKIPIEHKNNLVSVPEEPQPTYIQTMNFGNYSSTENEDIQQKLKKILQLQAKNSTLQTKYDEDKKITLSFVSIGKIYGQ